MFPRHLASDTRLTEGVLGQVSQQVLSGFSLFASAMITSSGLSGTTSVSPSRLTGSSPGQAGALPPPARLGWVFVLPFGFPFRVHGAGYDAGDIDEAFTAWLVAAAT